MMKFVAITFASLIPAGVLFAIVDSPYASLTATAILGVYAIHVSKATTRLVDRFLSESSIGRDLYEKRISEICDDHKAQCEAFHRELAAEREARNRAMPQKPDATVRT